MSILIKGVEMPVSCVECPCANDELRYCYAAKKDIPMFGKPDFCPLVEVEARKTGKWKRRIVDSGYNADWVCSECKYRVKTDFVNYKFCPNCGANMRGEQDE